MGSLQPPVAEGQKTPPAVGAARGNSGPTLKNEPATQRQIYAPSEVFWTKFSSFIGEMTSRIKVSLSSINKYIHT